MPDPRDYSPATRRHIAQGFVDPKNPLSIDGLTAKGEVEAERRHFGDDYAPDAFDSRYDPGVDGPS